MKNKIILFTLLVSLSFNIGFVIMFGYAKYYKPKNTGFYKHRYQNRFHSQFNDENLQLARSENIEIKKAFFLELAKPDVSYNVIDSLRIELEESQKIIEHSIIHNFIQLRQEIENDEAEETFGVFLKRFERSKERYKNQNENRRKK